MPAWRLSLLRPNYLPVTPELFSVMREKCPCYCPDPYLMVLAQTFEHKSYCDADLDRCLTILPVFFLFVRAEPRPAPLRRNVGRVVFPSCLFLWIIRYEGLKGVATFSGSFRVPSHIIIRSTL